MQRRFLNQSGNAIFIILIAIVIFAGLSYTVNRSMRGGGDLGGKERLNIQTSEILSFANAVETATKAVMVNGCTESQVTFEDILSGYTNSNAPSDKSCNIFNIAGGGVSYIKPNKSWLDKTSTALTDYGDWRFVTGRCINGVGTTGSGTCAANNYELFAVLRYLSKPVCEALNKNLNINATTYTAPSIDWDGVKFQGIYATATAPYVSGAAVDGQRNACIQDNSGAEANTYLFYKVLIAR